MTKFSASQQSQLAQIGAFLRENREKQKKALEDISIRTYIRPQLLKGIETGDPDMLPEPIFVQGFIRRYAEALGLKGTELAQQFTVTSIPSTPRPPRQPAPADTASTRIGRATPNQTPSPQNSATTPILGKRSSSLPNDPFLNGNRDGNQNGSQGQPISTQPATHSTSEAGVTELASPAIIPEPLASEVPLIVEEPLAQEVITQEPIPEEAITEEKPPEHEIYESSTATNGRSATPASEPELDNSAEAGLEASSLVTGGSSVAGGNVLERADDEAASHSTPSLALETQELEIRSEQQEAAVAADEPATAEVESLDTSEETHTNGGAQGYQSAPIAGPFDDGLPASLTTEATPAVPAVTHRPINTGPVGIEPVGVEPVGTEYGKSTAPNLKPFIIGGVVAALTAGVVILVSLLGGGDRQPEVAGNTDAAEQPVDDGAPNAETFLEEPEGAGEEANAESPASTAPVYVEAKATGQAWVSVIADGSTIFEGTLQPGDTKLWEAQENLNIFAGNAGAIELAPNGDTSKVMGNSGQKSEQVFTPE